MKVEGGKFRKPHRLAWFAAVLASGVWAYAFVARFTPFFLAPRAQKLVEFLAAWLAAGLAAVPLFRGLLPTALSKFKSRDFARLLAASLLIAAILIALLPPLSFPENHRLEIRPLAGQPSGSWEIRAIRRVELPARNARLIAPSLLDLEGQWKIEGDAYPLVWAGGGGARIGYARFMQAGIELLFATGPAGGVVEVTWDGRAQIVDLQSPAPGLRTLTLEPAYDWLNLNASWKILVGLAFAAQFLGSAALLLILMGIPRVLTIRHPRIILLVLVSVVLILPLANAVDPVVRFGDPALEQALRTLVGQPEGGLRQHRLLTIAALDISEQAVSDLNGIQALRGLASLNLRNNRVTDITPLAGLTKLTELDLRGNSVSDIAALTALTDLEALNLRDNPVGDISPLSRLTRLRSLNLHGVSIGADLALLGGLKKLARLNISGCGVTDLNPLAELMASGALQDDARLGIRARLDIRENPIPRAEWDGYAALRPYWENISERAPYQLPVFDRLNPPLFSHPGGFYPDDFDLRISTDDPAETVFYTLDGSEPTQRSARYRAPIRIGSDEAQAEEMARIEDISPQWRAPIGAVDRGVVVRAQAWRADGSHSAQVVRTYLVDSSLQKIYSLPVVSLTIDPRHLYDYDSGIYTLGRVQEELGGQSGNYRMQGAEWERPANFEFFNQEKRPLVNQAIGLRIHGATTRSYPQKSLRLYASDQYGKAAVFTNIYFPTLVNRVNGEPIAEFQRLLLRSSGNSWNFPFYRDNLLQTLMSATTLDAHAFRPVNVFLNGEYWGIYNLREYLDRDFLAARYLLDPEEIVILENNGQINAGDYGDEQPYLDLLEYIALHDMREQPDYQQVAAWMDVENFIDYQIAEIYARNENWPFDNVKFWRRKTTQGNAGAPAGQDGRWRWLLHDLDTGFSVVGGPNAYLDNTLRIAEGEFLYRSLLENETFRVAFISRFADLLNTAFTPERVVGVIDSMQAEIAADLPAHLRRWAIQEGSVAAWEGNVQIMRTFAERRPDALRQHIVDRFGLAGSAQLTILHDSRQGGVRVNTIDLNAQTPGVRDAERWTGVYFIGVPLTVSASPAPGYRFAAWEGLGAEEPTVTIILQGDMQIKAIFEPLGSP